MAKVVVVCDRCGKEESAVGRQGRNEGDLEASLYAGEFRFYEIPDGCGKYLLCNGCRVMAMELVRKDKASFRVLFDAFISGK